MKKSLLFVNGHLQVGGVEKALVDLLSSIDYERYEVDLLLLEGVGEFLEFVPEQVRVLIKNTREIEGPFFKSIIYNFSKGRLRNVLYRIVRTVAQKTDSRILHFLRYLLPIRRKYDVAVAFRPGHSAEIVIHSVRAKKKLCWWHHAELLHNQIGDSSLLELLSHFSKIIPVSYYCSHFLKASFPSIAEKLFVIPNVINIQTLEYRASLKPSFPEHDYIIITTVSRISPEKNVGNVVYAAQYLISHNYTSFKWYVLGDGPERIKLEKESTRLGLEKNLCFLGNLNNPYPYVKQSDLYVNTSYNESQCLAVLEAMALGVPCLVTSNGGVNEYAEDSVNSFICEQSPEVLGKRLFEVIQGLGTYSKIIESAKNTVSLYFSPARIINLFEKII